MNTQINLGKQDKPTTGKELFSIDRKEKNILIEEYENDSDVGSEIDNDDEEKMKLDAIGRNKNEQEKFKKKLCDLYENKCVITGSSVKATLKGAHIIPYSICKNFDITNGLLLRSDIHDLFDNYDIGIEPETLEIKLGKDIQNEPLYNTYINKKINIPKKYNTKIVENLKSIYKKFQEKNL